MAADRLVQTVGRIGQLSCLGATALAWQSPGIARLPSVQWAPWLAGLLVLGIPHGALDHRVGEGLGRDDRAVGPGFYAAYLAAGFVVLVCWFVSPRIASAGFLAVAALHFGQGDVYWSRVAGLGASTRSVGYRFSLILTRGALPIVLPLIAFPTEFTGEVEVMAQTFFGRSGWILPETVIARGIAGLVACVTVQVSWAAWIGLKGDSTHRRAAVLDISETILLAAMFSSVPPVLALGVYFNAWHSLRHVARLMDVSGPTRTLIEDGQTARAIARFARQALPMTGAAAALTMAMGLALGRFGLSTANLGLLALVMLSALTLPHVLVVAWMDWRQGIWSRSLAPRAEETDHVRI